MDEAALILQTVGDLELTRRRLLVQVQELQQQVAMLNGDNPQPEPVYEEAHAHHHPD